MVREDIVGALQSALSRGYPLKSAMQSLLNAGYSRMEIEEAARALNNVQSTSQIAPVAAPGEKKVIQRVSDYTEKPKPKASNVLIYILVGILILLIIGLIAIFVFKDQVIDFIKGLLGK